MPMLRCVADTSSAHAYRWVVITDCNTPQEQRCRNLTLEEATKLYQNSTQAEKRRGVTKDSIATVDIVRTAEGEQVFFEDYQKLESFNQDPVIAEAVEQLHLHLDEPEINMTMGGM